MNTNRKLVTTLFQKIIGQKKARCRCSKDETVKSIAQSWLENSSFHLKESSYIRYRNLVWNHILPELGEMKISEVTTERVQDLIRQLLCKGRKDGRGGLSEKMVKDILALLKTICRYAVQKGFEVPCCFELVKMKCTEGQVQILDREERTALERFLLQDDSLIKTGILLSLYMGLRLGEVCALKKRHIIYKEEILQVRSTMQRIQQLERTDGRKTKVIVTAPKSSSSVRDIPIPLFLMERLERLRFAPEDSYILTGKPERFIEPRTMENNFKRFLRECRITEINYHALRHTFATHCIENGFDVKTLSEILGHANVNITLNRYVHSSMERKKENMKKLQVG